MLENPFILEPYYSKEYFCDREQELQTMLEFIHNRSNVTLISPRRYGKTGLIYRTFDELKSQGSPYECFYVDIYSASCLDDFVRLLCEAVVNILHTESLIQRFFHFLGAVRPVLTYDPASGKYSVSYSFQTVEQKQLTLKGLLAFLEQREHPVVLAIDEFQQIREFDDASMEALLRTYIQPLHNVRFIFCGSKKHMMINMFTDPHSPFYDSTECLYLDPISADTYSQFAKQLFERAGRTISDEALSLIMHWSLCHTFYTQSILHRLYASGTKDITLLDVQRMIALMLKQREATFLEQRNLLTRGQWKFLAAVAKEEVLTQPTSSTFLNRYNLGAPSAAKRTLQSLVDKELVLETATVTGNTYRIYNVFLLRWLAQNII